MKSLFILVTSLILLFDVKSIVKMEKTINTNDYKLNIIENRIKLIQQL
jgi:hypothetical protein